MSELVRTSSSESASPSSTVIQSPFLWNSLPLLEGNQEDNSQKKRGRPRMDDAEVVMDESTSEADKLRIIYKRRYARNYRQKLRADIMHQEELRQMLAKVEAENRQLKETLQELRQENSQILTRLVQSANLNLLHLAALSNHYSAGGSSSSS
ncbi:hypothetical protein QR680_009736 [Steinernema hermaphroditum]|uniref:BZIP domain-containing protein n=1 Tax=Steinernema hermaphroditum TaxID=289476 RepID=A0AA39MAG2_9BILA|nr:hypothetical protein QR680_009736 [Steinernema hermaphroditum]